MGAGRPEKRNEKGAIAPFALACFAFRRQLHYPVYAHFACSPQISAGRICARALHCD